MSIKNLTDKAIRAALKQDWHQAIEINLEILDLDPFHIPTLNRLGRAYVEVGQVDKAIQTYQQVIKTDRFNRIAQKKLDQLSNGHGHFSSNQDCQIDTNFIDEPGKTKTIPLTRIGHPTLISTLQPGQEVQLALKNHSICVTTHQGDHIGALTDDMAFHLRSYITAGNTYRIIIKSASTKKVLIFIREVNRSREFLHTPTFTTS